MHETGEMWPDVATNGDYTAIVSERHHARLSEMVEEVRSAGATVLQLAFNKAGNTRIFPPTVVIIRRSTQTDAGRDFRPDPAGAGP
jgi:coniferyl-aldehyde dehydrogenase